MHYNILIKKDVVYVKADKGNQIVILDKNNYEQRVIVLIAKCGYKQVKRNPLQTMVREVDCVRQIITKVFSERTSRQLIVPNPAMP